MKKKFVQVIVLLTIFGSICLLLLAVKECQKVASEQTLTLINPQSRNIDGYIHVWANSDKPVAVQVPSNGKLVYKFRVNQDADVSVEYLDQKSSKSISSERYYLTNNTKIALTLRLDKSTPTLINYSTTPD
jgi:hypothetical protein